MSMLLEALKKAALEKKTRLEQKAVLSNLVDAHRHQHLVSTQQAEPADDPTSETGAAAHDPKEDKPSLSDQQESERTFEYELTEAPAESTEILHDMSDEIDLSDLDEVANEELLLETTQFDAQQSKEALIASIVEDALSQTEEKQEQPGTNPEKNKAQTKEAFSRLIEKSKSREKVQNRRLIVVSSSFVIVSITLGILYYLFLSTNESDFLVPLEPRSSGAHAESEESVEPGMPGIAEIAEEDIPPTQEQNQDPTSETPDTVTETQAAFPGTGSKTNSTTTNSTTTNSTTTSVTKPESKSSPSVQKSASATKPASDKTQAPEVIQMDPLPEKVQLAYRAYQNGNIEDAMALYQQAHTISPDNVDVLLGLAACSIRLNKAEDALLYYQQVLHINSKDRTALAGLLSITSTQANDPEIESRLRNLINDNPADAHLYFLMGNVYLSQLNWGAANTQFSKAVSLESHNPNYLYNLAISYDQLGDQTSALRYYRQAQTLTQSGQASFSLENLASRIQTLQQQLQ